MKSGERLSPVARNPAVLRAAGALPRERSQPGKPTRCAGVWLGFGDFRSTPVTEGGPDPAIMRCETCESDRDNRVWGPVPGAVSLLRLRGGIRSGQGAGQTQFRRWRGWPMVV